MAIARQPGRQSPRRAATTVTLPLQLLCEETARSPRQDADCTARLKTAELRRGAQLKKATVCFQEGKNLYVKCCQLCHGGKPPWRNELRLFTTITLSLDNWRVRQHHRRTVTTLYSSPWNCTISCGERYTVDPHYKRVVVCSF